MGRTANEILDDFEAKWAPGLRAVSLAAELQLSARDVRLAALCLGVMYQSKQHDTYRRQQRLKRYPASMVVALSGVGALEYEAGTYWAALWDAARVQPDEDSRGEWGGIYLTALSSFKCPIFASSPLRYVGPILLHSGVPRYCLGDLVDLVGRRMELDAELDGARFVQWATATGRESRLQALDKPAQRFLTDAGEFAVDWMDRLVDLIDRLRDPAPDFDGIRLPDWVIEQVRDHLGSRLVRAPRRQVGVSRVGEGARLALDPYGAGVQLILPPVGDQPDGEARWHVTLDGELHVIRSRAAWPGASETVPGTSVTLARPVRSAAVALGTSSLTSEVEVVDPQDPLLVFADDGRRLPASLPLPPEPVWVLHPSGGEPLKVGGAEVRLAAPPAPYGWQGWTLSRLDLVKTQSLRLGAGPRRHVRGMSRARLNLPLPVAGVTTAYGSPVFPAPPAVLLPATDGAAALWSVIVRRPGERPLTARDVETRDEQLVDAFASVPRPLVGPYQVIVRGPLGRGLSRELEIVEDLTVTVDPPWREFTSYGLVPCVVQLRAAATLDRVEVRLGGTETGFLLEAAGGGCTEVVEVTPQHMAVQVLANVTGGRWTAGPVRLETESLGSVEALAVRLPDVIREGRVLLLQGEQVVQSTPISSTGGGAARLDVRRFADTVGTTGSGRLELELLDRRIPLALLRPRRLAASAALTDDASLVLKQVAEVQGLAMAVYAIHKPWLPPVEASVNAGVAGPLPGLIGHGPLLVHLRVDDPWLPASWPSWPPRENTFRCDAPLDVESAGWEQRLALWLAGKGRPPADDEAVPALLTVYERSDELALAGVSVAVRDAVGARLDGRPLDCLTAAALTTTASSAAITAVLIEAGAVWAPGVACIDPSSALWSRSPAAAVLAMSTRLRAGDQAVFEDLIHVGGAVAAALLKGEPDPTPAAGRFGPEALRFASLSKDMLDSLWRAANIVPAQLLDADSRVAAARQLFDVRSRPGITRVAPSAQHGALRLARQLRESCPVAATAIEARMAEHGWQSLPALSLALALTARAASRGDDAIAQELPPMRQAWATLARHAPSLVEIDLVLAECLLLGAGP